MKREKKVLLLAILLAVVGWATTAVLVISVGALQLRAVSAEGAAAKWKRQAGKAYTDMLKARAGTNSTVAIIPKGSRIECTMISSVIDGKTVSKCEEGTVYPPLDY